MKLDKFKMTDPELYEIHNHFMGEVVEVSKLDDKTRYLGILSTLIGCQGQNAYEVVLIEALERKAITPIESKEIVYQAIDYLGLGRVYAFLEITNQVFDSKSIFLPLENQGTTTKETRLEKGINAQITIFGNEMEDFWKKNQMNHWLASNCFGDYYTRNGLDLGQRELITFCFLLSQGGCEPQLMSHIFGNFMIGNNFEMLLQVVLQCLPYIGYPRALNAITAINNAKEKMTART